MINFSHHPQYWYAQNIHTFKKWRLQYYASNAYFSYIDARNALWNDVKNNMLYNWVNLGLLLSKFAKLKPDIAIVTATCDRRHSLIKLYESIIAQKFNGSIAWIVVDNGSSDNTEEFILSLQQYDKRIFYLSYKNAFGYAAPVRNRGLMLIQSALPCANIGKYACVIDSDDQLHNEYSLSALYHAGKSDYDATLIHGIAICHYKDKDDNIITTNTIPRFINNSFPVVEKLQDEFDTGPQILAGLIPLKYLGWFYYPDEFTFEDDTLNRKIMLWSRKKGLKITTIDYPTTIKSFHYRSLSGRNAKIGPQKIAVPLGPTIVKGIRAQVVLGLLHLRDYFTMEGL